YLLKHDFQSEVIAVRDHYMEKGVSEATATAIAKDLLNKKPLQTVVRVKYDIELGHYLNPWNAAFSSLTAAAAGGLLPLLAMVLAPVAWRWEAVILAVILTSALTGFISSK
ncbi:VIT1/CCC1 transporter family protein, partial [Limosilactobacillus mucosae]|nr:VIT1/CCC1 transporter family protein [Limosilactobacillus mucosae]